MQRPVSRRLFFGQGLAASLVWAGWTRRADACDLTTADILGPYFVAGAPTRTVIASADEAGMRLFLTGRVFSDNCITPLGGTIVDVWQASNAGCYSRVQTCPDEDPWNLRGQMLTNGNGEYAFETILPGYYTGRCRHVHFRFAPISGSVLVTQLYFRRSADPERPVREPTGKGESNHPARGAGRRLHGVFDIALNVTATDAADEGDDPEITRLHAGYPNPFRDATAIRFSLHQRGPVELTIFDVAGRRVRTLFAEEAAVGYHTVDWDGRDDSGRRVLTGIYFCRLSVGGRAFTQKLVRLD
jgi:catechol 1,2-dioxygenase